MNFTNNWFETSELRENIHKVLSKDSVNKILEIGSYEGAFSCYASNEYLDQEGSFLVCIDPFDTKDSTTPVYNNIKEVFISNIKSTKNWNKIILKHMYSNEFFKNNNTIFNFIYIDGSHVPSDIENDFNNSMKHVELNGIIWMDDYKSSEEVKKCIDTLYDSYKDTLEIVHSGYQIAFKKIK